MSNVSFVTYVESFSIPENPLKMKVPEMSLLIVSCIRTSKEPESAKKTSVKFFTKLAVKGVVPSRI